MCDSLHLVSRNNSVPKPALTTTFVNLLAITLNLLIVLILFIWAPGTEKLWTSTLHYFLACPNMLAFK